jgi:hypothetical protein
MLMDLRRSLRVHVSATWRRRCQVGVIGASHGHASRWWIKHVFWLVVEMANLGAVDHIHDVDAMAVQVDIWKAGQYHVGFRFENRAGRAKTC